MPIYEYECKQCGTRFEKMQLVTADPVTECLNCGQGPVRRILHPVGVIFKGSGWYITDSRNSAKPKDAPDSSADGRDSSAKPEGDNSDTAAKKDTPAGTASGD